jgi:hypothetical protein
VYTAKFVNRVAVALVLGWLIGSAATLALATFLCVTLFRVLQHFGVLSHV